MLRPSIAKWFKQVINKEAIPGSTFEYIITFGYIATVILAMFALYLAANHAAQSLLFNADSLWMEDYLRDLLYRSVDMKTWLTPGEPNFFPEMLLYGLVRYVTGSVSWGYISFGLVKLCFYIAIFYNIIALVSGISRICRLWFSMLCSSVLMLVSIILGRQFNFLRLPDFWQLFSPAGHGGAIASALIAICLTLQWLRDPARSRLWFLLLQLLSIVACLSDRLYTIWFLLPALGSMVILFLLGRVTWKMAALFSVMLLISDTIGRVFLVWLVPLQVVPYNISFGAGLVSTIRFYLDLLFAEGWYYPLVVYSYICLVLGTIYIVSKIWKARSSYILSPNTDSNEKGVLFLLPFAGLVFPSSFFAMALINRPEPQYFSAGNLLALSIWIFFLVLTPFGLGIWSKVWFHALVVTLLIGYIVSLAIESRVSLITMLTPANPYSALVACLDSHAADFEGGAGYADYWQARPINLFSKKALRIDQAQGDNLAIFQWASNQEMFGNRKHTFVITDTPTNLSQIHAVDVINIYGQPDTQFLCAGYPVLVYHAGIEGSLP